MARFLNPAKICLLSLIEMYTDEKVPNAAAIPVLSFIASHLIEYDPHPDTTTTSSSSWDQGHRIVSIVASISDFETLLSAYPVAVGLPGRKLWDTFSDKLWDINSLHMLHVFFERQIHAMVRPRDHRSSSAAGDPALEEQAAAAAGIRLTRNSPFGSFIRRCQLEFTRLRFHDVTDLWKEFVKYRQPTIIHRRKRNPSLGRMSFDNVLEAKERIEWDPEGAEVLAAVAYGDMLFPVQAEHSDTLPVSGDDLERLLEFQIGQMQKHGNRVPIDVRNQFQKLIQDSTLIPSLAHYLTFLDAWRSGDYPTAFDYLHRYFDYTMQNRDRLFYQYALMNLAVLQADFGCHHDAVSTMLETVSTARENKDLSCLNFSLNWLFHYGSAHPNLVKDLETDSVLATGRDSLAFLRAKAKEGGMFNLWASALLSEAKLCFVAGDSVATAAELMTRSAHLIVQHNLRTLFGSQFSMTVVLWERLGLVYLSSAERDVFLRSHAQYAIFDDELKAKCRNANALAENGRYDDALHLLESVDENALRSWKTSQYWNKQRGIIKLERDIRRNDLVGAQQLLAQLMQAKEDDVEPDLAHVIDFLHVELLMQRGDLKAAFAKSQRMLDKIHRDKKEVAMTLRMMIVKAKLFDKAGRPQRGFTLAMRAASMAWKARLIPALYQAVGALANILSSLGEFVASAELLTAILPRSLECDSKLLSSSLYSYLADAQMGMAGDAPPESTRRSECLTQATKALEKALDCYRAIGDVEMQCEMVAKKAVIMEARGDKVLAADCAAAYVALRRADAGREEEE